MKWETQKRILYFLVANALFLLAYHAYLLELIRLSFSDRMYSHVLVLPFVSGYLMWKRRSVFSEAKYSAAGGGLIGFGFLIYLAGLVHGDLYSQTNRLSMMVFSALTFWIGTFWVVFGGSVLRACLFPLLFLVFMIPIPTAAIDIFIPLLQRGSAEAAYVIFKLTGVPVLREGFVFDLPGITIEVAEACSGIRSAVALFITSVMAGYFLLSRWWGRLALSLAVIPITMFKNGLRIVTLSLMGVYVDEKILTDSLLHTEGGIPFFILALILMTPVWWVLRKIERRTVDRD